MPAWFLFICIYCFVIILHLVAVQSIGISMSARVSGKPHVKISQYFLYTCRWIGAPLMKVQYIMYFQFCGLLADLSPLAVADALVHCSCCIGIMHWPSHLWQTSAFFAVRGDKSASRHTNASFQDVVYLGSKLCHPPLPCCCYKHWRHLVAFLWYQSAQ